MTTPRKTFRIKLEGGIMAVYLIWLIVGFLFVAIELATPTLFFLNLALGALFGAVTAYFIPDLTTQVIVFVAVSSVSLLFLRPLLLKHRTAKPEEMGIEGKYIGHEAQVIQKIGEEGTNGVGKIKIYGEVWDAKTEDGSAIEPFEMVEILRNESLVMFVKRVEGEK